MKKLSIVFITSFLMMLLSLISTNVDAGFGGRSSSSSSSSSSRSISISRPSSNSVVGGAKQSSTPPIQVNRDNIMSSIGKKGATGPAAGVLFRDFQSKNSPPINSTRPVSRAQVDQVFTPTYRASRRSDYYGGYHPQPSTQYSNYVRPSYGIWDAMIFASIMDNVGDRQMYWNHQNDSNFKSWRIDANAACVAGDQDVCDKLKDLDREMDEYKAKGTPINPAYMTPGIDPDIYEANNVDVSKLAGIKVCTGSIGSDYSRYAATITKVTKLKVIAVPTNGSIDSLAKMATGECNIGFVQDDIAMSPSLTKLATLKQLEVGLLVCNKDSKIKTAADIDDKHTIYVGSDQTGSQFTINELKTYVSTLGKATINNTLYALQAAETVQTVPNACFFAVSTPEFPGFMSLDKSNKAYGVPIFSFNMTKEQPYKLVTTDVAHYKNLTQDQYKKYGMFTPGGTDTIAVSTSLVAPQSWTDQNKDLYNLLLLEKANIQTALQ